MAKIEVRQLNFTYPTAEKKALEGINLMVSQSEFIIVCGKSGCGKSTLLRHLKKNLTPYGVSEGEVLYNDAVLGDMDERRNASEIGFVQQNPDNQLVTDKVWHELAFGLESLGLDNSSIKRRVAEMASFFDIQTWFRKNVADLSGGQKQLLNLASVMVMQPKILILDEPTSQLDPIAASEFLKTIYKINRDLGTTVIISEHRLEELFPMADRVVVMEQGKIIADDKPWVIGNYLAGENPDNRHPMFYGLPSVMKIYSYCRSAGWLKKEGVARDNGGDYYPLTIRSGRLWLEDILGDPDDFKVGNAQPQNDEANTPKSDRDNKIISLKNVSFCYNKETGDVLKNLSLDVNRGEFMAVLGGNGVGKSTMLKVMSGILKPQGGNIIVDGIKVGKDKSNKELFNHRLALLPQNPQALFTEITSEEELLEGLYYSNFSDREKVLRAEKMLKLMELSHLAKSHPYDLSGGEQQRLALGKILLMEPSILLLDEPTKGLDPFFKITLAEILKKLKGEGVTIFMVSHDIEFCAEYADRCAMFFDGEIVSVESSKEFFKGNSFYTTTANRMARQWFPEAVTWEEVCTWVGRVMTKDN